MLYRSKILISHWNYQYPSETDSVKMFTVSPRAIAKEITKKYNVKMQ